MKLLRFEVVEQKNKKVDLTRLKKLPTVIVGHIGWLKTGRIFQVKRTEVEPFDRIAGIEWNAVELYRI